MLQPVEKTRRQSLVHHPSSVLDSFGHYDATSEQWRRFDEGVTEQLAAFEAANQRYIRPHRQLRRTLEK